MGAVEALLDELDSTVSHSKTSSQVRPIAGRATITDAGMPRTASSATRELDELMASLSDFKVNAGGSVGQLDEVAPSATPDAPAAVVVENPAPDTIVKVQADELPSVRQPSPVNNNTTNNNNNVNNNNNNNQTPTPKVTDDYAKVDKQPSLKAKSAATQPPVKNLDSMLGNLQRDMSVQGVTTVTKGVCAACNKPIIGQVCTALGKTWHPEHFSCCICETQLGTQTFFERDGKPYCEEDYHDKFAPKCHGCNGPILDSCVTSMDRTWHPKCFVCNECRKPFGEAGFHEKDGKAYCRDDYFKMFAPKCSGCNEAIIDNYITALNGHWHPQCFVCMECHQPFHNGSFFEHESMPYCEVHYHARRGSLCYSCQKPITGRCITAMHRKFHPEHFICAFCLKQLNKGTFKEQNDKPYCHGCFIKLFG
jgi:paxillin